MVYKFILNWLDSVEKNGFDSLRKNRKCILFSGGGIDNNYIITELKKKKISISNCITDINSISEMSNSSYFVIVIKLGMDIDIISKLRDAGFSPWVDYLYIYHDVSVCQCTEYYRDIWGNEIIVNGQMERCNVRFKGWNSKLIVGKNCRIDDNVEFNIGSNSIIILGDNVKFSSKNVVRCEDNSKICIQNNCSFGQSKLVSRNEITIGNGSVFNDGFIAICEDETRIQIGEKCLFSSNVHMRSGNGHSLFDITSEENISEKSEHIILGNHVWVGQDTTVLFNAELEDDCVVGAKSLVKGKHKSRSLVDGVPAKTMKENIGWNVKNHMSFEEFREFDGI